MKKRTRRQVTGLAFSLVVGLSASVVGMTYAAYVYNRRYSTPIEYNIGHLSSYFAGGSGVSAAPYIIETPVQVRNLQKLNVYGVFNKDTYFKLSDNISESGMDWDGVSLAPIGSEDYPFYSNFNGNGKIINNLVVDGSQTNDIGMFGYVAMGASVANLVLASPTINVTNENNPTAASTTNPLASVFSGTDGAASLEISLTTRTSSSNLAHFTANKTSLSANGVNYSIIYESSNEELLYQTANNVWYTKVPNNAVSGKLYPVQLAAKVFALYDNMVISYTLERWEINVEYNGDVSVGNLANNEYPGFFKTLHATSLFGPHGTYVGFLIGHLDGTANSLGVYGGNELNTAANTNNAKIMVHGRQVMSYSSLIGRTLNDNVYDDANANFDRKYFDFDKIIRANIAGGVSGGTYSIPNPSSYLSTDYSSVINNVAVQASNYYGLNSEEASYLRFYPGLSNGTVSYPSGEGSVSSYALSLANAPLSASVRSDKGSSYNKNTNFFLRNGIWLWLNAGSEQRTIDLFSDEAFTVIIKITYVATGSTNNYFQILFNKYNPSLSYRKVRNDHWNNLSSATDSSGNYVYDATAHPLIMNDGQGNSSSGQLVSQQLSFTVNKSDSFWDGLFSDNYGGLLTTDFWNYFFGTYYLMFGIGVGSTMETSNSDYTTNSTGKILYSNESFYYEPFSLNIIGLDIYFTSVNGDLNRQVTNVDFLYDMPTYENGVYTAWNSDSNVKIKFTVGSSMNNSSLNATYNYYRTNTGGYSGTAVHVKYTGNTGYSFEPSNTDGYNEAVID